eukprot:1646813-Pleurochrysis_carterae.AAC.1
MHAHRRSFHAQAPAHSGEDPRPHTPNALKRTCVRSRTCAHPLTLSQACTHMLVRTCGHATSCTNDFAHVHAHAHARTRACTHAAACERTRPH